MAVGIPGLPGVSGYNGAVEVYEFVNDQWVLKGDPITGKGPKDYFGKAVALSKDGNRVAIGAPEADFPMLPANGSGYVQVHIWNASLEEWELEDEIFGTQHGSYFGEALDMNGTNDTWLAIGAHRYNSGNGRVEIWHLSSPNNWTRNGNPIDGTVSSELFGTSLALAESGQTLVVGNPIATVGGNTNAGRLTVYRKSGSNWSTVATEVTGSNAGDGLGEGVDVSGTWPNIRVAIGLYGYAGKGQVRVLDWTTSHGWVPQGGYINTTSLGDNGFGGSVALDEDGERIAILYRTDELGAYTRVFEFDAGGWSKLGNDILGADDYFDLAFSTISISGNGEHVAIGGRFPKEGYTTPPFPNTGRAEVFHCFGAERPQLLSSVPYNGTTDLAAGATLLTLSFDQEVQAGNGIIQLFGSDGTVVNFDITDPSLVTFNGNTMVLSVAVGVLKCNTDYYIMMQRDVIQSRCEVGFNGFWRTDQWTFSTGLPVVSFTASSTQLCAGNGFQSTLTVTPEDETLEYTWTRDGQLLSNSTHTLTTTQQGTYQVTVNFGPGCVVTSDPITLTTTGTTHQWPIVAGSPLNDCLENENGYGIFVSDELCPDVYVVGKNVIGSQFGDLTTPGASQTLNQDWGFLARYDHTGNLIYAVNLGMTFATGTSVKVHNDRVYVAGYYFDVTLGDRKVFVGSYNASNGAVDWIVSTFTPNGGATSMDGINAPDLEIGRVMTDDPSGGQTMKDVLVVSSNINAPAINFVGLVQYNAGNWNYHPNQSPLLYSSLISTIYLPGGCLFSLNLDGTWNDYSNNGFIDLTNFETIRDLDVHKPYGTPSGVNSVLNVSILHSTGTSANNTDYNRVTDLNSDFSFNWTTPIQSPFTNYPGIDQMTSIAVHDDRVFVGGNLYATQAPFIGPSAIFSHHLSNGIRMNNEAWFDPFYMVSNPPQFVSYSLKDMDFAPNGDLLIGGETSFGTTAPPYQLYTKRLHFSQGAWGTLGQMTTAFAAGTCINSNSLEAIAINPNSGEVYSLANYDGELVFPMAGGNTTTRSTTVSHPGQRILITRSSNISSSGDDIYFRENVADELIDDAPSTDESLVLYPNPTKGDNAVFLNLGLTEDTAVQVAAYDLSGRLIAQLFDGQQAADATPLRLEVGDWEAGVYLIQVRKNDATSQVRLVKQ